MRKLLLICALTTTFPLTVSEARAQSTPSPGTDASTAIRAKQEQLIGAIASVDAATGQVTIKTDAGKTFTLQPTEQTEYLRIAPGERTLDKAAKIARADLAVGDRVLVRGGGGATVEGQAMTVRQLIVISREALAGRQADDWRRRGINGRITALNPETKEITIAARSRDAIETITINASGSTRLLRYAPDSLRREDAQPASFADLKVGDQLRALGDREGDGARFKPEEIIAGSFMRVSGTITNIDAAKGEIKIKDDQTGKTLTVVTGAKSTLRRIPPDFVEQLMKRREEMLQRRAQQQQQSGSPEDAQERQRRREERQRERAAAGANQGERGQGQRRGPGQGGGGFQQILESMPAVTTADLKKGDGVLITGTPMSDASRLTAITLVTGDASLVRSLQQFQGPGGQRSMNPGLPGDVVGGGTGEQRERP